MVSLKVIIPLVVAVGSGVCAWLDIKHEIALLQQIVQTRMADRWTARDDRECMRLFAITNGLDVPPQGWRTADGE